VFATSENVLSAFSTLLAVLIVIYTFAQAGRLRHKHGIEAPATTGHPQFERALRVQMNTVEQFVIFFPVLWLASIYFHYFAWLPAILGVIWCVGRILYSIAYIADPKRRGIGFNISFAASMVLLVLAALGIVNTWIAVNAS